MSGNWKRHDPLPFRRFRLLDGAWSGRGDSVMCRKVDGQWQYRALTEAEAAKADLDAAEEQASSF